MSASRLGAVVACALALSSPAFAQPQTASVAELSAALAIERAHIAALERELAARSAALSELGRRLDALSGVTPTSSRPEPAPPAAAASTPPAPTVQFYGDTLLRFVSSTQRYDDCVGCPERFLGRMRLRFGVEGRMAPGLRAVMGVASGELNDPNSVYQTFSNSFSRKVVSWDRAYLNYQPPRAKWLELTAGKFPYSWVRSSMTFDVDFYPEGASERVFHDMKRGPLSTVSVQGIQLIANEQANGPDTRVFGGQAIAGLRLGARASGRVIATTFDIQHPEHILRAELDRSVVSVPNTNALTAASTYRSAFRYANVIADANLQTRWDAWPITTAVELQRNVRAASDRDTGMSFRIDAGRAQRTGDWQFGWHVFKLEQDAILSAFGESDWRAPTNVLQHRFIVTRMLHPRVQALVTWYRGRTLDTSIPGAVLIPGVLPGNREPWANRLYFDVGYRY